MFSETDKEYKSKINYSVHAEHFKDGKFDYTPIIADIRFARDNEEAEANAKLIAAAPKLYTELLNAINSMQKLLSLCNLDEKTRLIYKNEIKIHEQIINEINQ